MTDIESGGRLSRSLGPLGIAFLTFSALSPAVSVYVFGAGVIHIGGTGAIAALLIGGVAIAIVGLLYGEIASAFPDAGGVFPAFAKILGPAVAFPYVAMMLLVAPAVLAFGLLGIADNVRSLAPAAPQVPVAIGCLVLAAFPALLNVRTGALITGAFLAVELAALAVIAGIAALHPARAALPTILHPVMLADHALMPLPVPLLGLAVVAGAYTCGGANWTAYFAGEMVDAERRIGRVIAWISPLAAFSIAAPLILALLATPDLAAMLASDAPLATFLQQTTSPAVATLINLGVLLAMFNAAIAVLMGLGRLVYATGRDRVWPRAIGERLGRLHPTTHAPVNATIALGVVAVAMMALGERILLVLVSNQLILEFLLLGLAALVGRRRRLTGVHHRTPLHPVVPVLAIVVAAALAVANWFDPESGRPSLLVLAAIVALSIVYERVLARRAGHAPAVAGNAGPL